jgi:hypothetical protein
VPNLAFHIETLDLVTKQLLAVGDPKGTLLANPNNQPFAALGALGPDLLRYAPPSQKLADALDSLVKTGQQVTTLPSDLLLELFLNPLGAAYSVVFRELVVPLWPVLDQIKAFLDKADAVAAAEDKIAAVELATEVPGIINQATGLKNTLPQTVTNLVPVIGQIIALPPWLQQNMAFPLAPSDPKANRLSEFLRWHKSGAFAAALVKLAKTPAQQAYALGWLVHYAGSITGEPFINNIAGGPYRTHWWRNRLAGNFVDAWTFGFVQSGAQMMGDNPTPPYDSWTPLCTANLQHRFNVTGLADTPPIDVPEFVKAAAVGKLGTLPGNVPQDIADLFMKAIAATYPAGTQPLAGFSAEQFKDSVIGALAVYWFMTSGRGPLGLDPIGVPPCLAAPQWISSGSAPSPQQAGLNTGGAVCAAILAILALLMFALGDIPGGLAALAAAVNAPIIDWGTVRCNLFWIRKMLVDAESSLREMIVTAGLAYPIPRKLGVLDPNGNTIPAADKTPVPGGVALCRTNAMSAAVFAPATYPHLMDASNPQAPAADLNFNSFPMVGGEAPATPEQIAAGKYPDVVLNGSGLQNGGLMTDGVFPSRNKFFGDAVSNALDVLAKVSAGTPPPDYNLDGDRGYGWKGWHPAAGSFPTAPPVQAQQD